MPLSAGALACIQDDGCFTLVCGDSSLCLCLTKCQQVSYSKIWQEELQSVTRTFYSLHTVKLTFIYLSASLPPLCPSVFAFNICIRYCRPAVVSAKANVADKMRLETSWYSY